MADKNPTAPRGHSVGKSWPSFRYGPDGESAVFVRPEDVPEGWADTPDAFKVARTPVQAARTPVQAAHKPAKVAPRPLQAGLQKPQNVQQELTKSSILKPKMTSPFPPKQPWPEPKGEE